VGLILIAAGAAGLVAVNTQLLPQLLQAERAAHPAAATSETAAPAASPTAGASEVPTSASAASGAAAAASSMANGSASEPAMLEPLKFEPNFATIRTITVQPLANYLKKNPSVKIALTGHGDERSRTRDYLDVGRARALAIRKVLLNDYRVPPAQVTVEPVALQGDQVPAQARKPGMVEVKVVSQEKGENHAP
jgi:outer membrane protein OmpA-like peptidoglycan-associated protein